MNRLLMHLFVPLLFVSLGVAQQPTTAPAHHGTHAATAPLPPTDKIWANLMAGNQRFMAGKTHAYAVVSLRRELAAGQKPHVIVLSCSDSRVAPELVFDQPR